MSATNGILKSEKQMKSHNTVNIQELRPTIFKLLLAFDVRNPTHPGHINLTTHAIKIRAV